MKPIYLAVAISFVFIGGAFLLSRSNDAPSVQNTPPANNVSIVDGQQIIDITVKGGYSPRTSTAKAGIPTILRFNTNGTFDCSSFVRIPSMNISSRLPPTGVTDITVDNPKVGLLQGMCGMGMYPFEINFQN